MTRQELIKLIESDAEYAKNNGQFITVNESLPYVDVDLGHGNEYFFQGEEASDLINSVPDWINAKDYILWLAQGW